MNTEATMAVRGPPAPKWPTACKPVITMTPTNPQPAPQAQQKQDAAQCAQQEPELTPPPAQVPDPITPPTPPAQVLDPIQLPAPPAQVPDPIQPYNPPAHVPNPVLPPAPPAQIPNLVQSRLNWSYFKPEFLGKPQEDVEAHLLTTHDWIETHNFPEVAKVQRFCLTPTSEARLWHESLIPIVVDWIGLQECFRQQYPKFGITQEQLFHVWRSFHYDENVKTIDAHINRMKQVAMLLNYGEPQILELFKNTLPSRLYWVLFSINKLRGVVDAAKRVLTKEKIDRQLSGQTGATTPFMKVGYVHSNNKTISFSTQDSIREQLDSLTSMVYNMSMQKERNNQSLDPQIHQKRKRGQS